MNKEIPRISDWFNITDCYFNLCSRFKDSRELEERSELYVNRLGSKRFVDAVLEDMTKKSKNTDIIGDITIYGKIDPELIDSIEAELDQLKEPKVGCFRDQETRIPTCFVVDYRIRRNKLHMILHVEPKTKKQIEKRKDMRNIKK